MGSSNETAEDQQQLQQLVVHQATIEDDPRRQQQTKMTFQQVVEQKMKEKQAGSKKHVMFLPSQGSAGHHEAPARLAIKKRELIKSSELTSPVDPSVPLPPSSGTSSLPLMLVDDILREEEEEEEQGEAAATAGTGRVTNTIIFIFGRRHKNSIT